MTDKWWDVSWNPVVGCGPHKMYPGCRNCYAEKMAWRLKCAGVDRYEFLIDKEGWTGYFNLSFDVLEKPLRWKKPRRIFVGSITDMFHSQVRDIWLQKVFKIIDRAPQHTYIFVTRQAWVVERWPDTTDKPNIWLVVTCENQEMVMLKLPVLLSIPAARRLISVEPMLSKVVLDETCSITHQWNNCWRHDLDGIICGAETGPGKREMKIAWARSLQEQAGSAGIPFWFKKDSSGKLPRGLNRRLPE